MGVDTACEDAETTLGVVGGPEAKGGSADLMERAAVSAEGEETAESLDTLSAKA